MKSVIIGAGTYGEVYLSYLVEAGVEVVGFLDDNQDLAGKMVRCVPVLGAIALLNDLQQAHGVEAVYCPIGNNGLRVKVLTQAQELWYKTPNFIHHSVEIASSVKIGEYGIYLLPSTVVMPWSEINDFVMVSVNTVISHTRLWRKGCFCLSELI